MRLTIQGVAIELLVARRQYELEALTRARREEFQGMSLAVVAPEDLIILKLNAGGPQDLYDVAGILQVQAGRLEEDYLEWAITRWRLEEKWGVVRELLGDATP